MTQEAINYARALYELKMPEASMLQAKEIFQASAPLQEALLHPMISRKEKKAVIERIFPPEIQNFLKVLCDHGSFDIFMEIAEQYEKIVNEKNQILSATLQYVVRPTNGQLASMKEFLKKTYHCAEVNLQMEEKPELLGGFVLQAGSDEYDWSYLGRFRQLQQKLIRR